MVALFLRPDADISDGGWTDEGGATTLFDAVDESSFSDTDYIKSTVATGDKVSLRLSDPTGTPTEPMTIRVRCKREGTDATDLISRLYEATSPPTLICYFEIPTVTDTFATYEHELPAAEFAAIGDFNNLYIEFESNPTLSHHGSQIDLNFQTANYYNSTTPTINGTITDYLSCSRASIGYAKTSTGTLTQFASNELRITNLGLLVEDSRTNECRQSSDFNSTWTLGAVTISGSTTAPDAGTAQGIITTAVTDSFSTYITINNIASGVATWSAYMKANGYNFGCLNAIDASNNRYAILVDLTTGAITDTNTTGTPAAATTSVESLSGGWFRLIISLASGGASYHQISMSDVGTPTWTASNTPQFTGNGSSGVYAWGAQTEAASFASSYIPTTTTSATRAKDVVTAINTLSTTTKGATTSIFGYVGILPVDASAGQQGALIEFTSSNRFYFYDSVNRNQVVASPGATIAVLGNSRQWSVTPTKVAWAWNASGQSLCADGGTIATSADVVATGSGDPVLGDNVSNLKVLNGYIRRFAVWTSRLADTTLQTLTAP